ncbi:MAG: hypothetical protein JF616_01110 [Fibrobacteres bacterium]|nr:hypothetical protein [Fibrobacterota bacterium]
MTISHWITVCVCALPLGGCTVIGGVIGAHRDAEIIGTREVAPTKAGDLSSKTVIYATLAGREPAKGRFRGVSDSAGIRLLRIETADGRESLPLDSVSDLVAEVPNRGHLLAGLIIGAAIDATLAGAVLAIVFLLPPPVY